MAAALMLFASPPRTAPETVMISTLIWLAPQPGGQPCGEGLHRTRSRSEKPTAFLFLCNRRRRLHPKKKRRRLAHWCWRIGSTNAPFTKCTNLHNRNAQPARKILQGALSPKAGTIASITRCTTCTTRRESMFIAKTQGNLEIRVPGQEVW